MFSVTDALQPDGPLLGVAFTGYIDREDPKVRPTLDFTTQDTEVTAVIGLGDVDEGSTVVVTWYRLVGPEEREVLFSLRFALVSYEPADGAEYAGFASMFGLPALPSGGPPVAVAVSGTSGTGQGAWQFRSGNPPATYSANGTIEVECVASCDEAVG